MNQKKQKPLVKLLLWLVAEVVLTYTGTDDLADYSEFVFERHANNLTLHQSI